MAELFSCNVPKCGFANTSDRMWNLDRKATKGKLVIVCGKHAHEARKLDRERKVFRLDSTIARDQKREEERMMASQFFAAFKAAKEKKAKSANPGTASPSLPATTQKAMEIPLPSRQKFYLLILLKMKFLAGEENGGSLPKKSGWILCIPDTKGLVMVAQPPQDQSPSYQNSRPIKYILRIANFGGSVLERSLATKQFRQTARNNKQRSRP